MVADNEPIIVNSPITYTNLKGATHTNPSTYQEGTAVTFSAPSEVTGYTFAGWTPSGITASMKGSQSVQANWQAHTYTIAYSGNGGTGHMSGTAATYDQDATVAGNGFTRGGFEFQGWALVATGEVAYVPGAIVRNLSAQQGGVVTLYAVWEKVSASDDAYDPLTGGTAEAKFGGVETENAAGWTIVQRSDAKFGTQCLRGSLSEVYDEVGSGAYYSAKFKGTGVLSFWWKTSCEADPAGEYTWDHAECWVDGRLVAKVDGEPDWQEVRVDVSDGGDHVVKWMYVTDGYPPENEGLEECVLIDGLSWTGEAYTLEPLANPVITPADGSTFTTPSCTVTIACATADAIIYYSANGRTPSQTETYRYKGAFTIDKTTTVTAVAVRGQEKSSYVKAVITKQQPISYTIAYDANGGEGSMASVACLGDESVTLAESSFNRTGYTFTGWATSATGEVVYANGATVSNLTANAGATVTLYAKWTANAYTVKFNANGGTGSMANLAMTYDVAKALTANAFTRTGCTFAGWATSASGAVAYEDKASVKNLSATASGTVTLYAVWQYLPLEAPVIKPADGASFRAATCEVTIACDSVDAVIYYSANGRTPSTTETYRYKGAFEISKTSTIIAVAMRGSEKSGYVRATITKVEVPEFSDAIVGKEVTGRDEPVVVPSSWVTETLVTRFGADKDVAFGTTFGADLTAALAKPTGKRSVDGRAMTVWDDYVAGTDPTDLESRLKTTIKIIDGKVHVGWDPNLNGETEERYYRLWGRKSLENGEWHRPAKDGDSFFKVEVDLPTGEESDAPSVFTPPTEPDLGGVQLWEGGPYWAECNVGAEKPEDYGYYFWWGDTVGYKRNAANDGWVSVKEGAPFSFLKENGPTYGKSNSQLQSAGYIDATGNLVAAYDAATAHLGAPWRMPTDAEFSALISNCTTTWTTRNGVFGRLVTGKGAFSSKSIFLPAAGRGYDSSLGGPGSYGGYWSSTPNSDGSYDAWYLFFGSGSFFRFDYSRFLGQSVRPLRGFSK
ncbi:MAG: InlB B-repeat-containing protein [Kiritimatiellia bacterium]